MTHYVVGLEEVDRNQLALVGGKGAHLGELSRIDGIRVPPGFCVTTHAFQRIMSEAPALDDRIRELSLLRIVDRDSIRVTSGEIRGEIERLGVPDDIAAAIVTRLDENAAYAIRSSATAEDLPSETFAGQLDTYLNIMGQAEVLQHVRRCWASLFTDRAVTYRIRNEFDHGKIRMAVVVQRMVVPQVAGILFTADPVTANRKVTSIDASFGLGEALVSGLVNADVYKVRDERVVTKAIGAKKLAITALPAGGTREQPIDPDQQGHAALTDAQAIRLAGIGRRIEAHFGSPQDIEWCLAADEFYIVQSRPITTLFPIPVAADMENRVYLSVGHQQMMTDAIKPLGLSMWQLSTARPMSEAGGRLFVDVTAIIASPASRPAFLAMVGKSDPLFGNALRTILDRGDFIRLLPEEERPVVPPAAAAAPIATDPAIVDALIERSQSSIATLKKEIRTKTGTELLDFIRADTQELKRLLWDPQSHQAIMAGMEASWWLNDKLFEWLGEKNAADTLTQSVPGNITSAMGLALLDVADVIRPHADVVAFLQHANDRFMEELPRLPGSEESRAAIQGWLDTYGMRGVGEIDITRPRWNERPGMLVPLLLSHIQSSEPGAAARRFEQGRQAAWKKEQDLLSRLRTLPDGEEKAEDTKRMIDRVRTFAGYREYPKYGMISRHSVYKEALMREAERLVHDRVIRETEDIFYLRFEELQDVERTREVNENLIRERRDAFKAYQALTPPRVLTSDGEVLSGSYRRDDIPPGALVGLGVSAGIIEGRARIIFNVEEANLEAGDILVTPYTDPSWTPLFVAVSGVVTEVGGLMTHGAVIAREYGLPAVVGVEHATRLIRDGQRIRLHGTEGYVEILS